MKLNVIDLMADLQITAELARKAVKFEAEQLAAASPEDLRLLFGCPEFLARKIVAYARVKTGGIRPEPLFVPRAVVANSVSIANLQAMYDRAINAWLEKGMIFALPLRVTIEGVDLWIKAVSHCFYIDARDFGSTAGGYRVWGPTSLVNALSTMGQQLWQLPIDGVLRTLISFAESYND